MIYNGNIIRNESLDPEYKVRFSYCDEKYDIKNAVAIYLRQSPMPKVTFDDYTDYLIERFEVDENTIQHIKLHIGKTVCDYIFSNRT